MMTKVSATVVAVMEGGNSAMVVAAMDVDEGRRGEGGVHRGEEEEEQAASRRSRRCDGEEEEEQAASRRCDGDGRWVAMATRSLSLFVLKLWGGGGDGRWVAMFVAVRSEIVGERRRREFSVSTTIRFSSFSETSIHCHWLADAAPETGFPDSCHYFSLCNFKHPDYLGEVGPDIGVTIPTTGHDLAENREAIVGDDRTDALVHHCKCRLHSCHVLEGKHSCDKFPQNNAKAVDIDLLCVRPVLDHLPAISVNELDSSLK
ncbi:hypothetical protein RHGRI_000888 [Rhododendron griersonianum]|uniref:Uncharacterized protein n=1 Tax=Rhododendron griersonianum TaxID=479676 RepID=A0AAV6LKH2_9ERIC|nr:hypothetical protein RHGRI_000888 [Rhododendron griersonianum]